jgi:small conductance mechanosensitive channel
MRLTGTLIHLLQGIVLCLALVLAVPLKAQEAAVDTATGTLPAASAFTAAQDLGLNADQLGILMVPLTATELSEIADVWQGYLRSVLEDSAHLNLALLEANGTQAKQLREQIAGLAEAHRGLIPRYQLVLASWDRKGAATEDMQAHSIFLSAVQGDVARITDVRILVHFVTAWMLSFEGGVGVLIKLAGALVTIWAMMFVARFARKLASQGLEKVPTLSRLLKSFVLTAVYWGTLVIGTLVVLALFGVNVTPLFAVVGGLSFILGFALQEVLGNLASGLMLMVMKPFDMGDFIQVAGTAGVVDEMSVISTQIRTFDNQIITVPNSKIWGDVITNVNASNTRRVDLVFGIAYSDNAVEAIEVLKRLVEADTRCLTDPEAAVFVGELGESSVNIFCRPWVKTANYWDVYWGLTGQAKERFDEEGISIPFPQRDVHLIQDEAMDDTG